MKKTASCSFQNLGVLITVNNGVHPNNKQHFSTTVQMTHSQFEKACNDRRIFGEMLGIDVTKGWQNVIAEATKGMYGYKPNLEEMAESTVRVMENVHGEEVVHEELRKLDEATDKLLAPKDEPVKPKKGVKNGKTRKNSKGKGTDESSEVAGRATADSVSDEPSGDDTSV